MPSWKQPTKDEIEKVIANLEGNLKPYFFSKLENPEWIKPLSEKGLLYFSQFTNEHGQEVTIWDAASYLIKIASEKPDDVFDVIKPFLDDINQKKKVNIRALHIVLEIAMAISLTKKEILFDVSKNFLSWLKYIDSIDVWVDHKVFLKLIKKLKDIGFESTALEIFSELLKLKVVIEYKDSFLRDTHEKYIDFKIITKFGSGNTMDEYYYGEILKEGNKFFNDNQKELFNTYLNIIKNLLVANSLLSEQRDQFLYSLVHKRSAIENHSQNGYNQDEPFFIILSALRDISEFLIRTNQKDNIDFVFQSLESNNSKINIRVILHLLRLFPNANKDLIIKFLTKKEYFDDTEMHHEYYLLVNQEFKNLSEKKQNIILEFIDNGPASEYYQKDEEGISSEKKKFFWKRQKLEPIRNDLSKNAKEKYKDILFQNGQEQHYSDHPEFLSYFSSAWGTVSPLENDEIKSMSIDDVITYLKDWKPSQKNVWREPTIRGLAESLEKDVKENPQKYLKDILKFKTVYEPTYTAHLFNALVAIKKSSEDWNNITELGLWALEQQNIVNENRDSFDVYSWDSTYIELLRLFRQFTSLENDIKLNKPLIDNVYKIIKTLIFFNDKHLLSKKQMPGNDYYSNAINSVHGIAVETLIEFALLLNNSKQDIKFILQDVDNLLNKSVYIETWAVFGRFLPWIDLMFHSWVEKNIDRILPENNRDKFDAAWCSYIKFVEPYDNIFKLLKTKFKYVLKNKLYCNVEDEAKSISKHVVIYYAREKIDLDDEIIKLIFNNSENKIEKKSFINHIGFSLKDNEEEISQKIIDRFKDLWDWWKGEISGREFENLDILKEFQWWYRCRKFDRNWAITQIHDLIITHKVHIDIYMIEKVLLEDLEKFTRKVFEIIKFLSMNDNSFYSRVNIVQETVKYIKKNTFKKDYPLKKEKDKFINKLAEKSIYEGPKLFDELKEYLE